MKSQRERSQKESIIHTLSYTQSFQNLIPNEQTSKQMCWITVSKSCLWIAKMPFKVFSPLSWVWAFYAFVPFLIDGFFLLFINSANGNWVGHKPGSRYADPALACQRSFRDTACNVLMKSPPPPPAFPLDANREHSWKDTDHDSSSMSSLNEPPFTPTLEALWNHGVGSAA